MVDIHLTGPGDDGLLAGLIDYFRDHERQPAAFPGVRAEASAQGLGTGQEFPVKIHRLKAAAAWVMVLGVLAGGERYFEHSAEAQAAFQRRRAWE